MNRAFDLALAGSLLAWGARGWLTADAPTHPVVVAVAALQLCVAILLIGRAPEQRGASVATLALAVPAVLIGAIVLAAAPPPGEWPAIAVLGFAAGSAFACLALVRLGRSFAVLPGLRRVVTRGPYRAVRHPAYLGEGAMVAAACLAIGGGMGLGLALTTAVSLVLRITAEERILRLDPVYREYAQAVRWRVLPGVW